MFLYIGDANIFSPNFPPKTDHTRPVDEPITVKNLITWNDVKKKVFSYRDYLLNALSMKKTSPTGLFTSTVLSISK